MIEEGGEMRVITRVFAAVVSVTLVPVFALEIIWEPEIPISSVDDTTSSASWSSQRNMAVGQDGRIHVIWADDRTPPYADIYNGIWYSRSDNGGVMWSIPRCISEPVYGAAGLCNYTNASPSITVVGNGHVHAFWDGFNQDYTHGYAIYAVSMNNGINWTFPVDPIVWEYWAVEPPSGFNSLVSDGSNYLVFYDQQWVPNFMEYRLLGAFSTDDGADWYSAIWHGSSTINRSDARPCTSCDSNDTGYIVWESLDSDNRAIILFGTSIGFGGDESTLVPYPGSGARRHPFIESDLSGNLYVVWSDSRDGNFEIYFKKSTDGGTTWSSDTGLTTASGASMEPSIILGDSGEIFLVWIDNRDGNDDLFFKYSEDYGLTWSADTNLVNDPAPCGATHIAISSDKTDLYVLWNDQRDGQSEVYFKRGTISIAVSESQHRGREQTLEIMPVIFKGAVSIKYRATDDRSRIKIYDATGRLVKQFDNLTMGESNQCVWYGSDESGDKVTPGVYFVHLQTSSTCFAEKIIKME